MDYSEVIPVKAEDRKQTGRKPSGGKAGKAGPKGDAKGQFVRRRSGSNPTRNPDGLHSANPVVLSGDGDATQPYRKGQKSER